MSKYLWIALGSCVVLFFVARIAWARGHEAGELDQIRSSQSARPYGRQKPPSMSQASWDERLSLSEDMATAQNPFLATIPRGGSVVVVGTSGRSYVVDESGRAVVVTYELGEAAEEVDLLLGWHDERSIDEQLIASHQRKSDAIAAKRRELRKVIDQVLKEEPTPSVDTKAAPTPKP